MKRLLLILSCLFISIGLVTAQTTNITGVVLDNNGEAVIGASVVVKGTNVGTATDVDGNFSLNVPTDRKTLVISFIGMDTKEVTATPNMRVVLASNTVLDEITVTSGYGVSKSAAFTGAASTVDSKTIIAKTDANPIKALDGAVAGLQMSIGSGQPGAPSSVFIRGQNSINSGTQPLYVIDGVPLNSDNQGIRWDEGAELTPLSTINSADIENIVVLKDASATSIYGARAANGVIVITTKRAKSGKTRVNLTAKWGTESMSNVKSSYKPLNKGKYLELWGEALMNDYKAYGDDSNAKYFNDYYGLNAPYTNDGMQEVFYHFFDYWNWDDDNAGTLNQRVGLFKKSNTDWLDEITRNGFVQEYNVDVQGGGGTPESARYYLSLNYLDNNAFIRGKDLTRYSIRFNLDQSPSKLVKFGLNTNLSYTEVNMGPGGGYFSDPVTQAYMLAPIAPVKGDDGEWFFTNNTGYNPVAMRSDLGDKNDAKQYRIMISPFVQLNFNNNFIFQTKASADFYILNEFGYWSFLQPQGNDMRGMGEDTNSYDINLSITNTLNYLKTFDEKHNLNVLVGQEAIKRNRKQAYLAGSNYAVDYLNEVSVTSIPGSASTTRREYALASFFGNVEYDYMSKYYLSASLRTDGSSRFGKDNRWGTFWSVGGKYRISAEDFMASTSSWLDNLVVRASYGTSGNSEVGASGTNGDSWYASRNLFEFGRNYNGNPGSGLYQFGNPNLKWEQTGKFNIGFDANFLRRFTVQFDYYNHLTKDMVFDLPVSMMTGLRYYSTNIGELSNKGFEVSLGAQIINTKDFTWNFSVNATHNKNKIEKLSTDKPDEGNITIREVGRPINQFKMKEWAGVDPATGEPTWYKDVVDANGNVTGKEITFDYNEATKYYVGDADPDLIGGFTTDFRYKGFDLSVQFNYSLGAKIYGSSLRYDEQVGNGLTNNFTEWVYDNRWQEPGDIAEVPKLMFNDARDADKHSSRFLMNGDYLKIRSLVFGYTLPKSILAKAKMENARVFMTMDNVYTFSRSNFRGFDPSGVTSDGVSWWNYPLPKNIMFGVTVGF